MSAILQVEVVVEDKEKESFTEKEGVTADEATRSLIKNLGQNFLSEKQIDYVLGCLTQEFFMDVGNIRNEEGGESNLIYSPPMNQDAEKKQIHKLEIKKDNTGTIIDLNISSDCVGQFFNKEYQPEGSVFTQTVKVDLLKKVFFLEKLNIDEKLKKQEPVLESPEKAS
jgi:hypothetical protein